MLPGFAIRDALKIATDDGGPLFHNSTKSDDDDDNIAAEAKPRKIGRRKM